MIGIGDLFAEYEEPLLKRGGESDVGFYQRHMAWAQRMGYQEEAEGDRFLIDMETPGE